MKENWPNFFIIGAPKAGTSSLYSYLKDVPRIYMSPIKEPRFFNKNIPKNSNLHVIKDKKKYLHLFEKVTDEKIIGEASPSYLGDPDAPHLIHEVSPHAKILISLRDPVERLISDYFMFKRLGRMKSSFENIFIKKECTNKEKDLANQRFKIGLYFENIKRYFDVFGRDQVKVIIFEEFVNDEKSTILEILKFLEIEPKLENFKPEIHNPFGVARGSIAQYIFRSKQIKRITENLLSPKQRNLLREKILIKKQPKAKINQEDKNQISSEYKNDVNKLKSFLGKDLPWSNFL